MVLAFNTYFFMIFYQDLKELLRSITSTLLIFRPKFLYDCKSAGSSVPESSIKEEVRKSNCAPTCGKFINCLNAKMLLPYKSDWVFSHEHSQFTGQQGKGEGINLTPLYHFHALHRHLVITARLNRCISQRFTVNNIKFFCRKF